MSIFRTSIVALALTLSFVACRGVLAEGAARQAPFERMPAIVLGYDVTTVEIEGHLGELIAFQSRLYRRGVNDFALALGDGGLVALGSVESEGSAGCDGLRVHFVGTVQLDQNSGLEVAQMTPLYGYVIDGAEEWLLRCSEVASYWADKE
tara:strand:- start:827 stop:1276 length:450 start_codon:yes stop_codon:yes gene_type:complete